MQHSHCSYCGTAYPLGALWPRRCVACGETTWRNPLPVAVALVPVVPGSAETDGESETTIDAELRTDAQIGTGLVVVRRDIDPGRGELALPGGYMEVGECWRSAVVRELFEETGIVAEAEEVQLFDVQSARFSLNVFGLLPPRRAADLPPAVAREEVSEWFVIDRPRPLAFPTHASVVSRYFASA